MADPKPIKSVVGSIFVGGKTMEHLTERGKILGKKFDAAGLSPNARGSDLCKSSCVCGGSGWFREPVDDVTAKEFGKIVPCPGVSKAESKSHNLRSGLLPFHYTLDWDSVVPVDRPTQDTVSLLKEFISRGHGLLYLHGSHGNAKSELLLIFTAVAIRAGLDATYYPAMEDLLAYVKDGFDEGLAESRIERLQRRKVLVIDEFDDYSKKGNNDNAWADQTISRIFKRREVMATRGELITVLASNEPPNSPKYDPSIIDRFRAHNIIHMTAGSKRGVNQED